MQSLQSDLTPWTLTLVRTLQCTERLFFSFETMRFKKFKAHVIIIIMCLNMLKQIIKLR
jgi:hypothetical protein